MAQRDGTNWTWTVMVATMLAIVATSVALPYRIATHFAADGRPNGFMNRGPYLVVMCVLAVGVPALVMLGLRSALRRDSGRINVPNRDFWLAPERRVATLEWLAQHVSRLAAGVCAFAFAVHLALIRANGFVPPRLEPTLAIGLLTGSLGAVAVWAGVLVKRFRR